MEIKLKKLNPNAVLPSYAKPGDAGKDLTATSKELNNKGQWVYGTGIARDIPENYVGLLFPRSSVCKKDLSLSNAVGVIDSQYRGEIKFIFNETITNGLPEVYNIGERIGQIIIMPYPTYTFVEVEELSDSVRGVGGFGSTGS
jgi:dUTP pyrophosphatase